MTESEWLECTDITRMAEYLRGPVTARAKMIFGRQIPIEEFLQSRTSERKARLFLSACCRRLWCLLDDTHCKHIVEEGESLSVFNLEELQRLPLDSCRKAIEYAERSADESIDAEELRIAWEAADAFHVPPQQYVACYSPGNETFKTELVASGHAAYAAYYACLDEAMNMVDATSRETAIAVAYQRGSSWREVGDEGDSDERAAHCRLLRDIVGNPFRPVTINPVWLTPTVLDLAHAAYDERIMPSGELDPARLSVLSDALEEAGCDNTDVLDHLRSPGSHVRGCWAVDLLLGKE